MAYGLNELLVLDKQEVRIVLDWYLSWSMAGKLKKLIDKNMADAQKAVDIQKKMNNFIYED